MANTPATSSADAKYSTSAVFMVFLFPALGGFLFGYDIGATSFVLTQLEDETYSGVDFWNLVNKYSWLQGTITSSGVGGALIGSIIVFRVADTIGRRVGQCRPRLYLCWGGAGYSNEADGASRSQRAVAIGDSASLRADLPKTRDLLPLLPTSTAHKQTFLFFCPDRHARAMMGRGGRRGAAYNRWWQAELIIGACLFILGALIEMLAGVRSLGSSLGLAVLLIGRWTYGIGCGFAMHGAPTYIGEVGSPREQRTHSGRARVRACVCVCVCVPHAEVAPPREPVPRRTPARRGGGVERTKQRMDERIHLALCGWLGWRDWLGLAWLVWLTGWMAKMSPAPIRGLLVSMKEGMIVLGILMGYLLGFLLSKQAGKWAITYGASVPVAVFMLFGALRLPRSARWLTLRAATLRHEGDEAGSAELLDAARASLRFVYCDDANVAEDALAEIQEQCGGTEGGGVDGEAVAEEGLFSQRYRKALVAGIGVVFLQQLTGQPSVLYYANSIFDDVGIAAAATVGTGAFKLVATLTTTFMVDRFGRRPLLLTGISMMLAALALITWAFYGYSSSDDDADDGADDDGGSLTPKQGIIIFSMFLYIGGYQVGFGPIAWTLISEIFPLQASVRGRSPPLRARAVGFLLLALLCRPSPPVQRAAASRMPCIFYFLLLLVGVTMRSRLNRCVCARARSRLPLGCAVQVRGQAVALAVQANFASNLLVSFFFPIEIEAWGGVVGDKAKLTMTFGIFLVLDVYSLYFVYNSVPETAGKTLEQIEIALRGDGPVKPTTRANAINATTSANPDEPLLVSRV